MIGAFQSSLSGMRSTQTLLDVTANNLANVSTNGFKTSRVQFADQFYLTEGGAQGPVASTGGVNPSQIGNGVQVATVDVSMTQGPITSTGRPLDAAITGSGFYRLRRPDGVEVYSRVGNFGFDGGTDNRAPILVDQATGYTVLNTQGSEITRIDYLEPTPTEALELSGNLPPDVTRPLHGTTLSGLFPITDLADGTTATTGSILAETSLGSGSGTGTATTLTLFGTEPDGTAFSTTVPLAADATVGELVNTLNQALIGANGPFATVSFSNGSLVATASQTGEDLSLFMGEGAAPAAPVSDAAANTWQHTADGIYDWSQTRFMPAGSSVTTTLESFSADGTKHSLEARFLNVGTDANGGRTWDLVIQAPDAAEGTMVGSGVIQGYTFNANGTLASTPTASLTVDWAVGGTATLDITTGSLRAFAGDGYADAVDYTGSGVGRLLDTSIDTLGRIVGTYSNGKAVPMSTATHQIGLAEFANPGGLESLDGSLWGASENSGVPVYVAPGDDGENTITGGAQEGSNVELSGEYTKLILAQRSFQSNSKAFQVADEMLQSANGLVR